jgi:P2X purinoceptor 4
MERVWDEADYVVPPAENGAFFVTTNIIVTPNQIWGTCPEVSRLRQTKLTGERGARQTAVRS